MTKTSLFPFCLLRAGALVPGFGDMVHFTNEALKHNRSQDVGEIEAYEKIIDIMEENFRSHHIARLQKGACTGHTAFPFVTIIDQMTRIADNFSNIGVGFLVFKKGGIPLSTGMSL